MFLKPLGVDGQQPLCLASHVLAFLSKWSGIPLYAMLQIIKQQEDIKCFTFGNPPFQDKRCENGSLLLFEISHFLG